MSKLAKYLNGHIVGNVFDRSSICRSYANDGSILEATPRLVALPENTRDLQNLVRFTHQLSLHDYELPITMRGNGIDKTGAAIGDGLVVSTERMNNIEEIDIRGRLIRAQPGVSLGTLNSALSLQGLNLPIVYDPRATLGGLIANCPMDDAFGRHGGIFQFIERVEVVLSNGDLAQLAPYSLRAVNAKIQQDTFEGQIYSKLTQLINKYGETIMNRNMRPFDNSGYTNITRVKESHSINLLPLMFASQGTLALVSDIILRVELLPSPEQHLVITMSELEPLVHFLSGVQELDPHTIHLFDLRIPTVAAEYGNFCKLLPRGFARGWVALVSFNQRRHRAQKKIETCLKALPSGAIAVGENEQNTPDFKEFSAALYGFLNNQPDVEHLPITDDAYVPKYKLTEFLEGLHLIEETLDLELPLFGSYLTSNYNVRPALDYSDVAGRKKAILFLRQYSQLVQSCGGSITGGSPEGRIKALSASEAIPPDELELYREIKHAFDPQNIFNPKVKLGADARDIIRHLRTSEKDGIVTP